MYLKESISNELETCYCAAIIATDGRIFYGRRHHNCLQKILARGLLPKDPDKSWGFMTVQGRFVDREEGLALQKAAGILSVRKNGYMSDLWSEDLYLDWDYGRDVLGVENVSLPDTREVLD